MDAKRLTPKSIANLVMADDAWHDSEYVAAADYDALLAERDALRAALRELALCANTVDCYTRNPGNFAGALCDMRDSSARAWELVDAARGKS